MQLFSLQPSPTGLPQRQEAEQWGEDRDPVSGGALAFPDPFALPAQAAATANTEFAVAVVETEMSASANPLDEATGEGADTAKPGEPVAAVMPWVGAGAPPTPVEWSEPAVSPPLPEAFDGLLQVNRQDQPASSLLSDPTGARDERGGLALPPGVSGTATRLSVREHRLMHVPSPPGLGVGGERGSMVSADPTATSTPALPMAERLAIMAGVGGGTGMPAGPMASGQVGSSQDQGGVGGSLPAPLTGKGAALALRLQPAPADSIPSVVVRIGQTLARLEPGSEPAPTGSLPGPTVPADALVDLPLANVALPGRQSDRVSVAPTDPAQQVLTPADPSISLLGVPSEGRQSAFASPPLTSVHPPLSAQHQPLHTQVSAVLVDQVRSGSMGLIEVSLSPVELGAIRFEMQQSPDGLHVHLAIERPETGDLVRRHVDQLLTDLRGAGFAQTTLSFGQWSQRQPADRHFTSPVAREPVAFGSADPVPAPPALTASGRLHLRL